MPIEIVYALNDKYAAGAAASIASLCKNSNLDTDACTLNIVYSELSEENISRLKETVIPYKAVIKFRRIIISDYVDRNTLYEVSYLTYEMYFRLLIARIFPDLDKALYIDCDTIVCSDICELYKTDISDFILAAVNDIPNIQRSEQLETIGLDKGGYFNSGLLLLNLNEFRNCSVFEKAMSLLNTNRDLICPDQDILNIVCGQKVKYLDDRWNFQWGHYLDDYVYLDEASLVRYQRAKENIYIIHYTSPQKPWNSLNGSELSSLFWKYAAYTPFWDDLFDALINDTIPLYYSGKVNSIMSRRFRNGKVGFKYILKFFRNWLIYKIRGRSQNEGNT